MAAMYAPNALEPTRWIPGDGFHLQVDGPPYRILKRQKFEFLSSHEVLIFEGCRALYRPPVPPGSPVAATSATASADDWVWDGALRIWVQVNFAPAASVIRRGTDLLCGLDQAAPTIASGTLASTRQNAAMNILPEVLDRAVFPEFEIVILDLRGGQSLSEVQAAGWPDPAVPAPFSAAGATALARRLLELNVLLSQSGLCLAQLHPDQLMIDANLNIRIRGIPLVTPVLPDGSFAPECRAELAQRAARDLVIAAEDHAASRAPGGWLMHRWLAAMLSYLVTGRWSMACEPLERWVGRFFAAAPASASGTAAAHRRMEIWELGLFHALFTETRAGATPALGLLSKLAGRPNDRIAAFGPHYMAAAARILERALQTGPWAEVLRLAHATSIRLPEIFHAAEAAAVADAAAESAAATGDGMATPAGPTAGPAAGQASAALRATGDFQLLNRLLDHIAHLENACDKATALAHQVAPAAGTGGAGGDASVTGARSAEGTAPSSLAHLASRLTPAPLPPPKTPPPSPPSPHDTATAETIFITPEMRFDSLGVPRERLAAAPIAQRSATWVSPLHALAQALAGQPIQPAFRGRLNAWLAAEKPRFQPAWLTPPLTPAERDTLQAHAPDLLAELPALVAGQTKAAVAELTAAATACATHGARELPRFERAVSTALTFAAVFDLLPDALPVAAAPAADEVTPAALETTLATPHPTPGDPLRVVDLAIASVEAAAVIEPAILARLLAGVAQMHPVARRAPRLAALMGLHQALTAGALAVREQRWFDALRALRPALDAWPQYPQLQTQWRDALEQGLGSHLAALQRCAAPGSDPTEADPAVVTGLVDLLQGPAEANARWLGNWLSQIRVALAKFFAALQLPATRAVPLERRRALATAVQPAFALFDPAGWTAFDAHLALTEQRRIDLLAAITNSRAQAALGKLIALWTSGESAQPAAAKDRGQEVLHLWLEQTTNAIDQMAAPADTATIAGLLERMLGPLHKLLELHVRNDSNVNVSSPVIATVVSLRPSDLNEAVQAIETDLYQRMLVVIARPADLALWQAGWAAQPFRPQTAWWQAAIAPASQAALADFVLARQALREHRLDDAYAALAGADLHSTASAGLARFEAVVPAPDLAVALNALLDPWQRLKVTTARARAKVDLDDAARQLAEDITAAKRLRPQLDPAMAGTLAELEQHIHARESARTATRRRQTEASDFLAQGNLSAAVREYQALKTDWPATQFPREQLEQTVSAGRAEFARALASQVAEAEREQLARPEGCMAALKAAAAGLEADSQREFFPQSGAKGGIETALAGIFQRWLADRNQRRYGVALLSGLQSGALPPDAAFWAATLSLDRSASAGAGSNADAGSSASAVGGADPTVLAALPCGAVGPDEWQAWLNATRDLYAGADRVALDQLAARLTQKSAELQADDAQLTAAIAAAGGLKQRAELLQQFTAKWRNGRQADQRRQDYETLHAQAQRALTAALQPPAANWLIRPFVHWRALTAVTAEAQVVDEVESHAEARQRALNGWLGRAAVIVAVIASAAVAIVLLH